MPPYLGVKLLKEVAQLHDAIRHALQQRGVAQGRHLFVYEIN